MNLKTNFIWRFLSQIRAPLGKNEQERVKNWQKNIRIAETSAIYVKKWMKSAKKSKKMLKTVRQMKFYKELSLNQNFL